MLTTIEKTIHLRRVHLFETLTGEELLALSNISEEQHFAKDDIIFKESNPGTGLYVLVSGKVDVFKEDKEGKHIINSFFPNEYFGEMSLLDEVPRSLDAIAFEETVCLFIPKEAFLDLMEEEPSIAIGIIRILSKRIREANLRF